MYSIVLTDGKIINVNATEVEWCEKVRMIKLINDRQIVARINMDNVVGWIDAEYKVEFEPQDISDRNLKMWEEIYAEEKRRERSE